MEYAGMGFAARQKVSRESHSTVHGTRGARPGVTAERSGQTGFVHCEHNYWWFGYAHYAPLEGLAEHEPTARLGPNAIDLSLDELRELLKRQRGAVKAFLLDQTKIAGIGNAYVHDILFLAGLHPKRKIEGLSESEAEGLWKAIEQGLRPSIEQGGAFYETNLFGEKGGFQFESILVGYREGQPCPKCATPIAKIKTGSTSSFICPSCQPLG